MPRSGLLPANPQTSRLVTDSWNGQIHGG